MAACRKRYSGTCPMNTNTKWLIITCLISLWCDLPFIYAEEQPNDFDAAQGIPMDNINRFSMVTSDEKEGVAKDSNIDPFGYILYCPCMGRFGNQAEQLLGALAFAKGLNRTLVLPPFNVYPAYHPGGSDRIRFSKWFQVEPLKEYHKVMTMEKFMKELAPKVWPSGKRYGFCFMFRESSKCSMKDGNPFGPFWNHFDVSFDGSVDHPGLLWDTYNTRVAEGWNKRLPASKYLVYAFQGAPGDYPSKELNQDIQKYIKFSKYISKKSEEFIKKEMNGEAFVAIHLRNGADMLSVCDDITKYKIGKIFCSEQCTGYKKERKLTYEMCAPPKKELIKKVKKYLKKTKARRLFIGTDNNPMIKEFEKALKKMQVSVHVRAGENENDDPIVDVAIMSSADYFIGNCVSSFSSFVRRQRKAAGKPTAFFGKD